MHAVFTSAGLSFPVRSPGTRRPGWETSCASVSFGSSPFSSSFSLPRRVLARRRHAPGRNRGRRAGRGGRRDRLVLGAVLRGRRAREPVRARRFFEFPSRGTQPFGLALQTDGTAWAADLAGERLGRVGPDGKLTEVPLSRAGGEPTGIAVAGDGVVWFTLPAASRVGRRAADGTVREFALPEGSEPTGIAVARDGAAWVVERRGNRIVRITAEGEISAWPIATPNAQPDAVALAPDGSLWVTLTNVSRLLRVSPDGTLKELPGRERPARGRRREGRRRLVRLRPVPGGSAVSTRRRRRRRGRLSRKRPWPSPPAPTARSGSRSAPATSSRGSCRRAETGEPDSAVSFLRPLDRKTSRFLDYLPVGSSPRLQGDGGPEAHSRCTNNLEKSLYGRDLWTPPCSSSRTGATRRRPSGKSSKWPGSRSRPSTTTSTARKGSTSRSSTTS